jgi:hypothetical protein
MPFRCCWCEIYIYIIFLALIVICTEVLCHYKEVNLTMVACFLVLSKPLHSSRVISTQYEYLLVVFSIRFFLFIVLTFTGEYLHYSIIFFRSSSFSYLWFDCLSFSYSPVGYSPSSKRICYSYSITAHLFLSSAWNCPVNEPPF